MNGLCTILTFALFLANPGKFPTAVRQVAASTAVKPSESKVACVDNSKRPSELPPPGPDCAKEEFSKRGHPFMFPAHDGIAFGVSSDTGKRPILYLWADNQTETTQTLYVCCILTLFEHIDVYDSEGHRLPSRDEQKEQRARQEGHHTVQVCSCSGWVLLQPHTIKFIGFANISDGYSLPAGRYVIIEKQPTEGLSPSPEGQTAPGQPAVTPGLAITIP